MSGGFIKKNERRPERRHRTFEPIFARDWGNKRRPSRQARYEPAYVISSARRRTTSGGRWPATTGAERRHRTFGPIFARDWGNKRRPSRQARYEPAYVISSARRRTTSGGRWPATTGAKRRHRTFEPCQGSKKRDRLVFHQSVSFFRARDGNRTRDPLLGKEVLHR